MALVDIAQLTQALNVTPTRVSQLCAEGMPKEARGQYDLGQCLMWYVRYLQTRLRRKATENDDGSFDSSISEERKRLLKAQADREELELGRARGDLMPVAVHEAELVDAFTIVRQQMLTLAPRLAPRLEGESRAVIKLKLNEAIRSALLTLARSKQRGNRSPKTRRGSTGEPGVEPSVPDVSAAAATAGERLG